MTDPTLLPRHYQEHFTVRSYETDPSRRLSPYHLMNYLQEAAANHVWHLGIAVDHLLEQGLTWVLSRMYMQLHEMPLMGTAVCVDTYPVRQDKYFFYRDFRVTAAHSGQLLAEATSVWAVMDTHSRKMIALPEAVMRFVFEPPFAPLPPLMRKLRPLSEAAETPNSAQYTVHWHQLDPNQHANNAYFAHWLLNPIAATFTDRQLQTLDLLYKAEALLHQQIVSTYTQTTTAEDTTVLHQLQTDNQIIGLGCTVWK
ncbi:acyl-[acyl-carrier-protein] thioesterase [Eisenibacter elegans]|jgi:acyl-ACP thioesterase|uniref:acyl-[acyl-carrier-protein] thioesterase n=1 Tax=Eisenibacter elegans TaxID=997 RepID=UPI0003F9E166|nr:acyl-ACP thioesterase domain-containing protein [Eisenibacter elegans]